MKKSIKYSFITLLLVFSFSIVNAASSTDKVTIKNAPASGGQKLPHATVSSVLAKYGIVSRVDDEDPTYIGTFIGMTDASARCGKEYTCTYSATRKKYSCAGNYLKVYEDTACEEKCQPDVPCHLNTDATVYKVYRHKYKSKVVAQGTKTMPNDIYHYIMVSGSATDTAYCVQPTLSGPGTKGRQYCLMDNVDLSKCESGYKKYYYCGLAQILFSASEEKTNPDGTSERVEKTSPDKYYGAVGTALRLWVAFFNSRGSNNLGNQGQFGHESGSSNIILTDVYKITMNHIETKGYNGGPCSGVLGLMCNGGENNYTEGFKLYKAARDVWDGKAKFLDGYLGNNGNEEPKRTVNVTDDMVTLDVEWTETFRKQWEERTYTEKTLECSTNELLDERSDCRMFIQITSPGKDGTWEPVIESDACNKEKCTLKISYRKKVCNESISGGSAQGFKFRIVFKNYKGQGYFRAYHDCVSPNKYQIMFTAAFNKVKQELESGGNVKNYGEWFSNANVPCECGEDKCSDFTPVDNTHPTCSGQGQFGAGEYDSYDKMSKSDPYMNCILNPCNQADKEQFNMTKQYGLNEKVCNVYCRKEVEFYLANKRKVYAGMQFKYDIGPTVLKCESTVNEIVKEDAALTSIVLQKRQCASEIYYDIPDKVEKTTWLKKYEDKVRSMITNWNEWKKWEELVNRKYDEEVVKASRYSASGDKDSCTCDITSEDDVEVTLYHWPMASNSPARFKYANVPVESEDPNALFPGITNTEKNPSYTSGKVPTDDVPHDTYHWYKKTCKDDDEDCEEETTCRGSCYVSDGYDGKNAWDEATYYSGIYKTNYENDRKSVAQLLFDLQDCNFYVRNGTTAPTINEPYGLINSGSAKEYIMSLSACDENGADECVTMEFSYEDALYGSDLNFAKEIDLVDSDELNRTYFCMNADDSNPDCYKYIKGDPNEIKNDTTAPVKNYIWCTGAGMSAKCEAKNINLPTNDYATFTTVTETDFWLENTYAANAYTGTVSAGGDDTNAGLSTKLGDWQFPVSNGLTTGGVTGSYDTKYHFDRVKIVVDDNIDLDYTCSYDVYNTTNLYDCATRTKDGNLDLSACTNTCYKLVNGVPVIKKDCNNFDLKDGDSKGYGFVYRNVNLDDLFPNSDVNEDYDKNNRPKGTNWSSTLGENVSTEIEAKGSDMYLDENNLKYSFILTPTAIKRIREYNTQQELMGLGYQDSNFISCKLVKDTKNSSGLKGFYNCKSEFLDVISQPNNEYDVYTVKFSEPGRGGN